MFSERCLLYRFFCITQTAENNFNRHFLMLGGIELYGTLIED